MEKKLGEMEEGYHSRETVLEREKEEIKRTFIAEVEARPGHIEWEMLLEENRDLAQRYNQDQGTSLAT
jgi:hypothetical protein